MTIVAVSGGFDPLHIGHIRLFKEARKLGDELVVILNMDKFLHSKKGYVFMPYKQREEVIRSIRYVDRVVRCMDTGQTVNRTLAWLKPNALQTAVIGLLAISQRLPSAINLESKWSLESGATKFNQAQDLIAKCQKLAS